MTKQSLQELRDNAANQGTAMYSFATEAGFDHETAQLICKANNGLFSQAYDFLGNTFPDAEVSIRFNIKYGANVSIWPKGNPEDDSDHFPAYALSPPAPFCWRHWTRL